MPRPTVSLEMVDQLDEFIRTYTARDPAGLSHEEKLKSVMAVAKLHRERFIDLRDRFDERAED